MKVKCSIETVDKSVAYLESMKLKALGIVVCRGMIACASSAAQSNKPAVTPAQIPKAQRAREYRVPLLSEGLKLSDFAGMKPRPELQDKLLKITGFIQNSPIDGKPATEETEVWLGYTKSTIYLVFICYDHHADQDR